MKNENLQLSGDISYITTATLLKHTKDYKEDINLDWENDWHWYYIGAFEDSTLKKILDPYVDDNYVRLYLDEGREKRFHKIAFIKKDYLAKKVSEFVDIEAIKIHQKTASQRLTIKYDYNEDFYPFYEKLFKNLHASPFMTFDNIYYNIYKYIIMKYGYGEEV